ncbi:MAG: type II secretion system protein [Calothrix sp. CSU_2_0]|nr:type II secretion system protein [Calothrix sp. CSU_2_0]
MIIETKSSRTKQQAIKLGKIFRQYKKSQQDGFTIIESLMAIIVVSILMIAIAPAIALSVANRVQSRRIEFGTQAARAYIDGVRSKVVIAPLDTTTMTPSAPTSATSLNCSANSYCTSTATSTTPTNLYCIDGDADGSCTNTQPRDMIIQAFRFNGNNTTATTGYSLGVRIYRADAFSDATALTSNPIQSPVGIGNRKAPLVVMTTEINDAIPKYGDLCDRTNAGLSATNSNRGCN